MYRSGRLVSEQHGATNTVLAKPKPIWCKAPFLVDDCSRMILRRSLRDLWAASNRACKIRVGAAAVDTNSAACADIYSVISCTSSKHLGVPQVRRREPEKPVQPNECSCLGFATLLLLLYCRYQADCILVLVVSDTHGCSTVQL